ncbi:DUF1707 SHOCT-like domain-containing protein [Streptomyces oryzae]|uniref:DUF1707 SHOCT-like domain-containing protein n=1 Tax=Streptomyces oryzae TaxID=1434886 RepID=UPI003556C17B
MSGEISPTGKQPDSGSSPELRASHADRDRVADVLRIAAGDGLPTAEELDERHWEPRPRRWSGSNRSTAARSAA